MGEDAELVPVEVVGVRQHLADDEIVVLLLDPDSELAETLVETGTAVVQLLAWRHRDLADAFAGVAPAPGGPFRLGTWTDTRWGPVLDGVSAWAGIRCDGPGTPAGWSRLVDGVLEHAELAPEADQDAAGAPLVHRRGRYVRPAGRG